MTDHVHVSGSLDAHGDCEAEDFNAEGVLHIDGMLNAGNIEIRTSGWTSSIREIGGSNIRITRSLSNVIGAFIKHLVTGSSILLQTGTIEGDDIFIENTKADVVRGKNVNIGADCEIGLVEYSGSFEQSGKTVVKEFKKI